MHINEEPDRTSGLSTDDLAQPAGTGTEREAPPSEAPVYPGEGAVPEEVGPADDEPATDATTTEDRDAAATPGAAGASDDETPQLLTDDEERGFRDRWQDIQTRFVDDPREAVHAADALVADVMQTLAATFAQHKKELEAQWDQGDRIDTEELRGALRRYRSFFNRLLST
ncbi:hypothetical protein ACH4PU_06375 [Streptomyces sp. NPDC021100]|uniref:hypothetical protein n=1 Tax=Streptomyces sp. NPDC021100 TaxID=3365114 RepID=UPI0037892DA9